MIKNIKDSHYINTEFYTLEVFYHYYKEPETNYEELEITKVILNDNIDVTNLYFDLIDSESLEEEIVNECNNH